MLLEQFPSRTFNQLYSRVLQMKKWRKRGSPIDRHDFIGELEGGTPQTLPSTRSTVASGDLWVRYLLDPVRLDGQYVTDPVTGQAIREMFQNGETASLSI